VREAANLHSTECSLSLNTCQASNKVGR
jgi:hypothetical protein